jgi:D-3-phosphoglycerate dehydrogenase
MTKIYLTHSSDALKNYYGERALTELKTLGDVTINSLGRPLSLDELIREAQGHKIVIASRDAAAPAALFDQLPELLAYCRVAVDIRNIDVDAASRHGVLVTQATPGFDTSVAEWVIGVMIDLSRGISAAAAAYWQKQAPVIAMGRELRGSVLGIVGYGFIGKKLAELGIAMGMRVIVSDPMLTIKEPGMEQVSFEEVLKRGDYVVCLAPATPATADLFNSAAFARMRPEAFFINASRGELVDDSALLHALDTNVIAGAAVDVGRAPDQMPTPALAAHPKLVASPHVGGLTPSAIEHQAMDTVRQVRSMLNGVMPDHAVNAEHAARLARLPGFAGALQGEQS